MASPLPAYNALTASARILPAERKLSPTYDSWQDEAWNRYDTVGEFEAAIAWKSNALSRVRLLAAEIVPGADEPEPLESGPAVEAMERLAGGTGGQAALMREMTIHLSVPGEGWLVGATDPETGEEQWQVYSADELRVSTRGQYEIRIGDGQKAWQPLPAQSIVVRFWDPHPRKGWESDSDARHALPALLELDLINKRIIAEITSRLASNGLLLYDQQKLSIPTSEQPDGAEQVDPFAALLVDVASKGIKNPSSPEATIPVPIGYDLGDMTAADVDPRMLIQHLQFTAGIDEKLMSERESAVRRLATSLDLPIEVLLGTGEINHWGQWFIEETGIKIHIAPKAELITHSLTKGFLEPVLRAAGEPLVSPNGGKIVVWYDPTEITARPDRSANVIRAYDRAEVPGRVLRREIGLSEDGDAMTTREFRDWLIRFQGRQPFTSPSILAREEGRTVPESNADESGQTGGELEDAPAEDRGAPEADDQDALPDDPGGGGDIEFATTDEIADRIRELSTELENRGAIRNSGGWWESTAMTDPQRVTPEKRNHDTAAAG